MKKIVIHTLLKAILYGIMIAFLAYIGGAVPFPYSSTIAGWPGSCQVLLFFAAGFVIFFSAGLLANVIRIKKGKGPLPTGRKRRWF